MTRPEALRPGASNPDDRADTFDPRAVDTTPPAYEPDYKPDPYTDPDDDWWKPHPEDDLPTKLALQREHVASGQGPIIVSKPCVNCRQSMAFWLWESDHLPDEPAHDVCPPPPEPEHWINNGRTKARR